MKNLGNAMKGAAWQTLENLRAALNGGPSQNAYEFGSGTPNVIVTASPALRNHLLLTAGKHTLEGNEVTVESTGMLTGGKYFEGGAPLTQITITAKAGGTAGNISVSKSTSLPATWATAALTGGASYSNASTDYLLDWPLVGIHAQGEHLNINNVHIEGVGIAINVVQSSSTSTVNVSSVDVWRMMDNDLVYDEDPARKKVPAPVAARQTVTYPGPPNNYPNYRSYSCALLISRVAGEYDDHKNGKDRVVVTNLKVSVGECKYLLRDGVYGVEHSAFGLGQFPNDPTGSIVFYARGDAFAPPAGVAPYASYGGWYDPAAPQKTFFIGPIS